jgi:hypothetical protein
LLDGFALHRIARQRTTKADSAILFEAMRSLFIAQVMGQDELDAWDERFRQPLPGVMDGP